MPTKQDKKRKTIKVHDLKPKKDAKGGVAMNHSVQGHQVQSSNRVQGASHNLNRRGDG
jgi:hypothetical protein